ncbi:MAG: hypothetical protein WB768_17665, partial [Bradyrhizobium sp.]
GIGDSRRTHRLLSRAHFLSPQVMAVIDRGNPDMRQNQEAVVQQSVHAATRIKQNLWRATRRAFKNLGAGVKILE